MNNDLLPFLNSIKELFHTEMDQQTSACLYGSSTTDDWVAARSDLDLLAFVPEEKIEHFGEKIKIWKSKPAHPILDGFVLSSSGNLLMVREFHKFEKATWYPVSFIPLIDLWKVKKQSIHLFGQDLKTFVPEISQEELKDWAIRDIEKHWIPHLSALISGDETLEAKIPLSTLIWTASLVARMLMLVRGDICSSKRAALQWLANEYGENRETMVILIEEFYKSDDKAITPNRRQAFALVNFHLRLLREVKR